MIKEKFELGLLSDASPDVLAWLVPAGRLFSWMHRSILVPVGWTLMGTRGGQDPLLVGAGGRYDDEDTQELLFVRNRPIACSVEAVDLQSSDGYVCNGRIDFNLRVIEEPAEIAAFRRTIMGSIEVLRRSDLQRKLQWELRRAIADLAAGHAVSELLGRLDPREVRKLIEERLGGICLSGGLNIVEPLGVLFDSPAYREHCRQQEQLDSRKRQVAVRTQIQQALASAQRERLGHLSDVLEHLQKVAEDHKDVSIADLLRNFSSAERAEMYSALWQLSPPKRRAWQIAAVSGQDVLLFEPANLQQPVRRLTMPGVLGPLRSASVDERSLDAGLLMVGARLGVHLLDLHTGEVLDSLFVTELDPIREIRGGVNACAMSADRVFATHSELGLLSWRRRMFNPPVERLFPEITIGAEAVRCVRLAEGRLWLAVNDDIWAQPQDGEAVGKPTAYTGSRVNITALCASGSTLYAGNEEGQLLSWDIGDPDEARVLRGPTGNPVESIDVLEAGAVDHLIVADRGNALQAIVVEDGYVRRYESGALSVRRASVADDLFVAMNDSRDRLIAWDPREPAEPAAVVVVPHFTGSSIQDLCVIPQA